MLYKTTNPHGGDIYKEKIILDYSSSTNPFGTPQGILDAVSEALPLIQHYPDPYCRQLVHAISEYENVSQDYILCGNGAAELIWAYCQALQPKSAVLTAPTFSEYALALSQSHCIIEQYILDKNSEFELDEGFVDFLESRRPDVVFLCNPNNPTGKLISPSLLEKILCFCKETDTRLFIDESFLDLTDDNISMKSCLCENPQLFILKAFTKNYAMAGIRLGYCMSSDSDLLKKMSETSQPWNVSLLAQAAGIAALREHEFLEKTINFISEERKWLKTQLESLGFWVCPSDANYILMYGQPKLDTELKKHGIAIRNCSNFYGLSDGWYRIAVRLHDENKTLIAAIKSVCEKR